MHLLIVRHGECLGQCEPFDPSPDSALSVLGEQQALATAQRLMHYPWTVSERQQEEQAELFGAVRPEREHDLLIISSPLVRALATATIIAQSLHDPVVEVWTELREIYGGHYCGRGRAELCDLFPHARLPLACREDGWDHGDASYEALLGRASTVLSMLMERFPNDERVVVVTHNGFANTLAHAMLRIPATEPAWFTMDNCAISHVRLVPPQEQRGWLPLFPPIGVEIVRWNDASHLADLV